MKRAPFFLGLLALLALLALLFWPTGEADRVGPATEPPSIGKSTDAGDPGITVLPLAPELSAALRNPEGPPEDELGAVGQLLYFHRQAFGENPVGDNGDVVAVLLGSNAKRAAWLPADCGAIVEGKLVDRWGTPYWFHAVSAQEMEIRSAGPDRELFTGDDLTLP